MDGGTARAEGGEYVRRRVLTVVTEAKATQ